jgi:hypothetical protein
VRYLKADEVKLEDGNWLFIHGLEKGNLGSICRLQQILNDIYEAEQTCVERGCRGWIITVKRTPVVRHVIALGGHVYAKERIDYQFFYKEISSAQPYRIREHMRKVRQYVSSH